MYKEITEGGAKMNREEDHGLNDFVVSVNMAAGTHRKAHYVSWHVREDADIYDIFVELIHPMLIAMGYHHQAILEGCRYLEEEYRTLPQIDDMELRAKKGRKQDDLPKD